jgi:hypothetical protein
VIIAVMVVIGLPGIVLRVADPHEPALGALIFGLAILSAAFLLSWGAETAEMDISQAWPWRSSPSSPCCRVRGGYGAGLEGRRPGP